MYLPPSSFSLLSYFSQSLLVRKRETKFFLKYLFRSNFFYLWGSNLEFRIPVLWIRILCIRVRILHSKWIRIQIQDSDDQKWKNTAMKILFFFKNSNWLAPRPPQRTPKLQEKLSALKRNLLTFSIFVGHFCLPWFRSESRGPIKSGCNPDPDPQHCWKQANLDPDLAYLANTDPDTGINSKQCSGSGAGSVCFRASWIRIRNTYTDPDPEPSVNRQS